MSRHMKPGTTHYGVMFIIMILSGLLSTMNVWANSISDVRLSLNDMYMSVLMGGWMLFFMGVVYREHRGIFIGLVIVIASIWCIRTQFGVNERSYLMSMIPHHSMAVFMSKKLLEKPNNIPDFLETIVRTQNQEISFMKSALK